MIYPAPYAATNTGPPTAPEEVIPWSPVGLSGLPSRLPSCWPRGLRWLYCQSYGRRTVGGKVNAQRYIVSN